MLVSSRNRQVCAEARKRRSAESEVKRGTMGRALPAPEERATELSRIASGKTACGLVRAAQGAKAQSTELMIKKGEDNGSDQI